MKNKKGDQQLDLDFSSQVAGDAKRAVTLLRLVHNDNRAPTAALNLGNLDMRARVLENLLRTRITKA